MSDSHTPVSLFESTPRQIAVIGQSLRFGHGIGSNSLMSDSHTPVSLFSENPRDSMKRSLPLVNLRVLAMGLVHGRPVFSNSKLNIEQPGL